MKLNSWTSPADLHAQVEKRWQRGDYLTGLCTDAALFPQRLAIKTPTRDELSNQFAAVRTWIGALQALPHYRLVLQKINHRQLGSNVVPQQIWLDDIDATAAVIGQAPQLAAFRSLLAVTMQHQPAVLPYLAAKPMRALALAAEWSKLLSVLDWLRSNPHPNIYLRQATISGVDCKFIENHQSVLMALIDLALPEAIVDATTTQFEVRYGFLAKPARIRYRLNARDVTLDTASFQALEPDSKRVFITENEINFLAFPLERDEMVIFGAGYGFDGFASVPWLKTAEVYYWGDIDTHGFAILNSLRAILPQAKSLLMDAETLHQHREFWGDEPSAANLELRRLSALEASLYNDLRDNRFAKNLRLEQERIGFDWVEAALRDL